MKEEDRVRVCQEYLRQINEQEMKKKATWVYNLVYTRNEDMEESTDILNGKEEKGTGLGKQGHIK